MSEITNMTDLMGEIERLRQRLAEAHANLEAQRTATYQAVAREHDLKQQLATATAERQRDAVDGQSAMELLYGELMLLREGHGTSKVVKP